MSEESDPNAALFGNDEEIDPQQDHIEHTFGRNPNRTSAMSDLFWKEMIDSIEKDPDIPPEARPNLVFKMTANSVMDLIMESLDPDTREEVADAFDAYLGLALTNVRYKVDLFEELGKALSAVERGDDESDEDFERRLRDLEDAWWGIPQPLLDGRTPSDAITEQARRYGLE